jgi:biotin transport system substrate-specific component
LIPKSYASEAALAAPHSAAAAWLRNCAIVLAGSLFVAACARISLPLGFTPVPLTLQPFAVLLLGLFLSPRLAAASLAAYLAEGAAGLPVFAPGLLGLAHLAGPTGGYLLSYPLVAFLVSWAWRRSPRTYPIALVITAAGSLLTLALGALWLGLFTHASAASILAAAILPFLPGDALKVISAASLAFAWQRFRRHR